MNYASPPRSVAKKHRIAWLGGFSSEYWKPDPHQQLFFSPKTQNKNESNLNLSNKKKKKTIKSKISYPDLKNGKKKLPVSVPTIQVVDIWLFWWSKSGQGKNNRRPWIFLNRRPWIFLSISFSVTLCSLFLRIRVDRVVFILTNLQTILALWYNPLQTMYRTIFLSLNFIRVIFLDRLFA